MQKGGQEGRKIQEGRMGPKEGRKEQREEAKSKEEGREEGTYSHV